MKLTLLTFAALAMSASALTCQTTGAKDGGKAVGPMACQVAADKTSVCIYYGFACVKGDSTCTDVQIAKGFVKPIQVCNNAANAKQMKTMATYKDFCSCTTDNCNTKGCGATAAPVDPKPKPNCPVCSPPMPPCKTTTNSTMKADGCPMYPCGQIVPGSCDAKPNECDAKSGPASTGCPVAACLPTFPGYGKGCTAKTVYSNSEFKGKCCAKLCYAVDAAGKKCTAEKPAVYNPCKGKQVGSTCQKCDPLVKGCIETKEMKSCQRTDAGLVCKSRSPPIADGTRPPRPPTNGTTPYDPCVNKKVNAECSVCDPAVKGCSETAVVKSCQMTKTVDGKKVLSCKAGMIADGVRPPCPTPMCLPPKAGCKYVASPELNDKGCPKYPCGLIECDDLKCDKKAGPQSEVGCAVAKCFPAPAGCKAAPNEFSPSSDGKRCCAAPCPTYVDDKGAKCAIRPLCCKAITLTCLSACAGQTGKEFCAANPTSVVCQTTLVKPRICCKAMTATCLACAAGQSVKEYCAAATARNKKDQTNPVDAAKAKPIPAGCPQIFPPPPKPPTVVCPQVKCAAPKAGCTSTPSTELNGKGCPKYPCGLIKCDGLKCDKKAGPKTGSCPIAKCAAVPSHCKYAPAPFRPSADGKNCCQQMCYRVDRKTGGPCADTPPALTEVCPAGSMLLTDTLGKSATGDCTTWYDGCNTCKCDGVGKLGACTQRMCVMQGKAYCKAFKKAVCAVKAMPMQAVFFPTAMCKICKAFPTAAGFSKTLVMQNPTGYSKDQAYAAFDEYCPLEPTDGETTGSIVNKDGSQTPLKCCKALTLQCVSQCAGMSESDYCLKNPGARVCPQTKPKVCCMAMTAECIKCRKENSDGAFKKLNDIFANPRDDAKRPTKGEIDAEVALLGADDVKTLIANNPYLKIDKKNAKPMLDKLRGDNGNFSSWTGADLSEAGKVLKGFGVKDIQDLRDDALFGAVDADGKAVKEGALETFGKVKDFSKRQAKAVVEKLKDSLPGGFAAATGAILKKAGRVLEGIAGEDIAAINDAAWNAGGKAAFKEVCEKKGALDKEQRAALKTKLRKDIPKAAEATAAQVEDAAGLLGLLDEAELGALTDEALAVVAPAAIEVMGPETVAKAFDAVKLLKLPKNSRDKVNGKDFALRKRFNKAQLKALLGKDANAKVGAFVDFVKRHDTYANGEEMRAAIEKIIDAKFGLVKKGTMGVKVTKVQDSVAVATEGDDSDDSRRMRRLDANAASGDMESVVRVETNTNTGANQVVAAASSEGEPTVVSVDATDVPVTVTAGASATAPALILSALAAACAMAMMA